MFLVFDLSLRDFVFLRRFAWCGRLAGMKWEEMPPKKINPLFDIHLDLPLSIPLGSRQSSSLDQGGEVSERGGRSWTFHFHFRGVRMKFLLQHAFLLFPNCPLIKFLQSLFLILLSHFAVFECYATPNFWVGSARCPDVSNTGLFEKVLERFARSISGSVAEVWMWPDFLEEKVLEAKINFAWIETNSI